MLWTISQQRRHNWASDSSIFVKIYDFQNVPRFILRRNFRFRSSSLVEIDVALTIFIREIRAIQSVDIWSFIIRFFLNFPTRTRAKWAGFKLKRKLESVTDRRHFYDFSEFSRNGNSPHYYNKLLWILWRKYIIQLCRLTFVPEFTTFHAGTTKLSRGQNGFPAWHAQLFQCYTVLVRLYIRILYLQIFWFGRWGSDGVTCWVFRC